VGRRFMGRRGWAARFLLGLGTLLHFSVFGLFPPGFQELEGSVADALEVGLVAGEAGEDGGRLPEGAEGEGAAGGGVVGFELFGNVAFAAADFDFEEVEFEGFGAHEAPAGGGELFEEVEVEGGFGPEVEEVHLTKGAEFVEGFVFEDDLAGGEAVGDGSGPAAGEALGGLGTVGTGAVGAGRIDAALGGHVWGLLEGG